MLNNKNSLYRKYRPSTFDDVAGHFNVVNILKKELDEKSFTHAFLLTGQRGTGKTSIARIFAKAINCKNLTQGNPCEICESCVVSNKGQSPDIYEIDAASNSGVDEIRNIKNNVSTMSILGDYKTYIIDEVHMLSKAAFNALLKTLEEPPAHAIFILATTEFSKIPQTIISRCQVLNFKKIQKQAMKERINFVAKNEGFTFENDNVIDEIYYLSDGSLRDALNMLEQLMVVNDSIITIESLKNIFYVASKKEKLNVIKNIINNDANNLIEYFENAENQGMDFDVFALSLIEIIKELIEYKITNNANLLSVLDLGDVNEIKTNLESLFLIADHLSDAYSKTKGTQINFNYILISLLKSINNNSEIKNAPAHLSEKEPVIESKKINEIEEKEPVEEPQQEPKIVIESHDKVIEPVVEINSIELEKPTEIGHLIKETTINQVVETKLIKPFDNPTSELQFDKNIQKENAKLTVGELVSEYTNQSIETSMIKNNLQVPTDDVINLLVGAKKEKRDVIERVITNWFESDQNGNLLNFELANKFIPFYGAKISAVSENEVLINFPNSLEANFLLNELSKPDFRKNLTAIFNEELIFYVLDKNKWEFVKKDFIHKKNNNSLPKYEVKKAVDLYYEKDNQKNDLQKIAEDIFGEDIKIGD
ncbi:DNA polymerase III subunit gamma/tau [Williamsoniiplasma luminosum]|uniref:DNA polymerase III subunit gamma/tau n=1 Tax=Williamsoniiplasma luminosum TaxID=214888 RepID=A0A2S0NKK8_9MOLU|nr:DNA polymerase III subunit gamma/tau [Williamsoniiplasma luminosum]AVP49553.1 MAG: DNA polymerase III, subunit gamma and tau [Williamsoniiplasma luminosum]